jgi:hypothetical protein
MKESYDFSKGIKNPYADKIKNGYTVTVHYDFTRSGESEEQAKSRENSEDEHSRKQA